MKPPEQPLPPKDETTVLHLGKFAHGHEAPASDEGATMFIRRAATATVAQSATPVVVPKTAGELSPEEMLGAMAYCYAKGVFSSSDIERKMLQDEGFREALGGVVPDPATIRRFRRLNREAIHSVLEQFYRRLRKIQPTAEVLPGTTPPEAAPAAGRAAKNPMEDTVVAVRREATDRLDKATFIDGMSGD